MTQVRLITTMAGPGGVALPGTVQTVTPREAAMLAAGNHAVIIGGETATLAPPEVAAVATQRGKRK